MGELHALTKRTVYQDAVADRLCALDCLDCPTGADGWRSCVKHGEPDEKADTALSAVADALAGDANLIVALIDGAGIDDRQARAVRTVLCRRLRDLG